jgi:hypothetical protein
MAAQKTRPAGTGRGTTTTTTLPRYCPCGCLTKLPYYADPDCMTQLPVPSPREAADYGVADLGLAPHDRERCEPCQAVGR